MGGWGGGGVSGAARLTRIVKVLARHGFGELAERLRARQGRTRPGAALPPPARLRSALEELGPSFVKLGQLLSTRADVLPPEYIEELRKLQDRVPAVPLRAIERVIERELRAAPTALFERFDPEPIAAASVAQVHRARLFTGEEVVVKVVRPGIERELRQDVRLMYHLSDLLERTWELARIVGLRNLVAEFERTVLRELDMLIEAGRIEKFARNFHGSDEIHIPAVHWGFCSRSVLTLEHIDGIKMDEVEEIRGRGIDPKEIALIGLRSFSRQLMEFGFFHADPHPGNTLVLSDGRVALIDFGITGYLDTQTMQQIANLFLGYAEHDYDLVLEALVEAGLVPGELAASPKFVSDLKDMSEAFYGRSLQHISVRDVYDQIMGLLVKYRVRLPRNLLLLLKTFVQTEALGKILGSDASLLEVSKPYAKRLLRRGYEARTSVVGIGKELRAAEKYVRHVPKLVYQTLRQTAEGRQRFELEHGGFTELGAQLERGGNRLTIGVVVAASVLAASLLLNSPRDVLLVPLRIWGVPWIPVTALLGLTGYVIATVLGLWLIVSIIRSGKL
jgi:ubiquinone biosynthesis protein